MLTLTEKEELKDMIVDATIIKKETEENAIYKNAISKNIKYINERIQRAKEQGLNYCCFVADYNYETDLKRMYFAKGYKFKPTGYCGGVWQDSEDIYW